MTSRMPPLSAPPSLISYSPPTPNHSVDPRKQLWSNLFNNSSPSSSIATSPIASSIASTALITPSSSPSPSSCFCESLSDVTNNSRTFPTAIRIEYHLLDAQHASNSYNNQTFFIPKIVSGKNLNKSIEEINAKIYNGTCASPSLPHIQAAQDLPVTHYKGLGRVAQVLRWISSTCLSVIDPSITPEIQATIVNGRLLIGSNASEGKDKIIPSNLVAAIKTSTNFHNTAKGLNGEIMRHPASLKPTQRLRHLENLYDFMHKENERDQFIQQAIEEAESDKDALFSGTFLKAIFNALNKAIQENDFTYIEIAPIPLNKRNKEIRGSIHAEQRVIEHVQRNQDKYSNADDKEVPLILSGTKPTCLTCNTTEQVRDQLAKKHGPSKKFKMLRFEDPVTTPRGTASAIGPLFPGNTAIADSLVSTQLELAVTAPDVYVTQANLPRSNYALPLKYDSPKKKPRGW